MLPVSPLLLPRAYLEPEDLPLPEEGLEPEQLSEEKPPRFHQLQLAASCAQEARCCQKMGDSYGELIHFLRAADHLKIASSWEEDNAFYGYLENALKVVQKLPKEAAGVEERLRLALSQFTQ